MTKYSYALVLRRNKHLRPCFDATEKKRRRGRGRDKGGQRKRRKRQREKSVTVNPFTPLLMTVSCDGVWG